MGVPMAEEGFKRKLAAILSADVEGYSRLMDDDEEATVRTLTSLRSAITDLVQQYRGRVVDSPGDNILAEFASVVDSVNCAVEIQRELAERNEELPDNRKMQFRIGVNLGDVINEDGRIYGDGVNIAARIESLSDTGGICISHSAYDQIKNKLKLGYEYLGEHEVKNIREPVKVYRALMAPEFEGKLIGFEKKTSKARWMGVAAVVVFIFLGLIIYQVYQSKQVLPIKDALAEKPSIAVLPFENMSNDPEQEYFSDGMTDELIGDLAKINDIFVISRNSAFTYKGKSIKAQQIAKDLNVRYILEGSVQRSGNKVRIRAQLIDGKTDHHLWSESYDGVMDDIFALQDKITGKIVSALAIKLTPDKKDKISEKGTNNLLAYDAYLKGYEHYSLMTGENLLKAVEYYQQAIEIDPNFSRAYAALAMTYWMMTTNDMPRQLGISNPLEFITLKVKARHYLEIAMINPTFEAYRLAAFLDVHRRKYDSALSNAEKSVALAPNSNSSHFTLSFVLNFIGRHDEALTHLDKAMKLDPKKADLFAGEKGRTYYLLGDYKKAVELIEKSLKFNPGLTVVATYAAASYAFLGQQNEAERAWNIFNNFAAKTLPTTKFLYWAFPFKDEKVFDRFLEGLVKAGFQGDPSDYYIVHKNNKLRGDQIKNQFYGKTASGYLSLGIEMALIFDTSGNVEFNYPQYYLSDKAKSFVENDQLCFEFEKWYEGIKYCSDYYNNPEGTHNSKSQYIVLNDIGLRLLSIQE